LCYVARLGTSARHFSFCLDSTLTGVCHEFFHSTRIFLALIFVACVSLAQIGPPPVGPPVQTAPTAARPDLSVRVPRPNAPPEGEWDVGADHRLESEGRIYHLRGHASIEGAELLLTANEIDYDEDTGNTQARGNVTFHQYV